MQEALEQFALKQARQCFEARDFSGSLDWLERLEPERRPKDLLAGAHAALAKDAIAEGQWGFAEGHLKRSLAVRKDALLERRLSLARRHTGLMNDIEWTTLRSAVDRAERLAPRKYSPDVTGTYACGAYHAWSSYRWLPWSRFVRIAKEAPPDTEDGVAALHIAGEFLSRVVFEETPLLRLVDVVVSVPANPARYVRRMVSLPDELARSIEAHFALPFIFSALVSDASDDLELKGLSWRERQEAIRGSIRAGDLSIGRGHTVLIVDDITTSGATLKEAARVVRDAGAADVYAMTLSHTEG